MLIHNINEIVYNYTDDKTERLTKQLLSKRLRKTRIN